MATPDRDSLDNGLVSIGEEAVAKSNNVLLDAYFTDDYKLHSPRRGLQPRRDQGVLRGVARKLHGLHDRAGAILVDGNLAHPTPRLGGVTVRGWLRSMAAPPIGMRPS